jgi:hypothetical protein
MHPGLFFLLNFSSLALEQLPVFVPLYKGFLLVYPENEVSPVPPVTFANSLEAFLHALLPPIVF